MKRTRRFWSALLSVFVVASLLSGLSVTAFGEDWSFTAKDPHTMQSFVDNIRSETPTAGSETALSDIIDGQLWMKAESVVTFKDLVFDGTEKSLILEHVALARLQSFGQLQVRLGSAEGEIVGTGAATNIGWNQTDGNYTPKLIIGLTKELSGAQTIVLYCDGSAVTEGTTFKLISMQFSENQPPLAKTQWQATAFSAEHATEGIDSGYYHVQNNDQNEANYSYISFDSLYFDGTETDLEISMKGLGGVTFTANVYLDSIGAKASTEHLIGSGSWHNPVDNRGEAGTPIKLTVRLEDYIPKGTHTIALSFTSSGTDRGYIYVGPMNFVSGTPMDEEITPSAQELHRFGDISGNPLIGGERANSHFSTDDSGNATHLNGFGPDGEAHFYNITFNGTEKSLQVVGGTSRAQQRVIDVRLDSPENEPIATLQMTGNGGASNVMTVPLNTTVEGLHTVYFTGSSVKNPDSQKDVALVSFVFLTAESPGKAKNVIAASSQNISLEIGTDGFSADGEYIRAIRPTTELYFDNIVFDGTENLFKLKCAVASGDNKNITLEVYLDTPTGTLIASGTSNIYSSGEEVKDELVIPVTAAVSGQHTVCIYVDDAPYTDVYSMQFTAESSIDCGAPAYESGGASISITNRNIDADSIQVIFAVYDGDGRLLESNLSQKVNTADMPYGVAQTFTADLDTTGSDTVKAFIWDSIEVMAPLAAAI